MTRSRTATAILILSFGLQAQSLAAQGTVRKDADGPVPRMADGTPNLGRTVAGKGMWSNSGGSRDYADILIQPPKSQGIPFQPWARALQQYREEVTSEREDPQAFCIPPPLSYTRARPMELIQLPEQKRIIQIMEFPGNTWREIFMDGRAHPPKEDAENFPTFMGHAVGRWEGDTLVVDAIGFNEGTWLDRTGHPHTQQLHIIERYTRTSSSTLHVEVTIDDPGAYTEPWKVAVDLTWSPASEINRYFCQENNRYQDNYIQATKGATGTGNSGSDSGHGHPAKGSFVGEWGPNANTQDSLLLLMDWDGKTITGAINPGPQEVPITRAELRPDGWTLRIEGGTGADRVVLDGKFENLSWLARSLTGTYTRGNQKGTFRITRQY